MSTVSFEVEIDLHEFIDQHEDDVLEIVKERRAFDNDSTHSVMRERLEDIQNAIENLRSDIDKL